MSNNDSISVIITTRNEENNIDLCLKSIINQTYTNFNIIVVDNFSTDNTEKIARKYTDNFFQIGPERSAQRNYGMITCSKSSYVMFVDADMILAPNLLSHAVSWIKQKKWVALYISEVVLGKSYWSQVRRFERSFYDATVIDGLRFFCRETFVESGGFDLNLHGPEDWDLDKRIKKLGPVGLLPPLPLSYDTHDSLVNQCNCNYSLITILKNKGIANPKDGVIYHNESEFQLRAYFRKKKYYAESFSVYITKWGANDNDLKKQLGLWYRYVWVFVENKKWIKLITHPHLALGLYFLRIVVGFLFLFRRVRD